MGVDDRLAAIERRTSSYALKPKPQPESRGNRQCEGTTVAGTRCRAPAAAASDYCAQHDVNRICGVALGRDKVCHQLKVGTSATCWAHDPENVCSVTGCGKGRWEPPSIPDREALGYAISDMCWDHDPNGKRRKEHELATWGQDADRQASAHQAAFDEQVADVRVSGVHACDACGPHLIVALLHHDARTGFTAGRGNYYVENHEQALYDVIGYHAAGHRGRAPDALSTWGRH